ncbi:MAG: sialidase family protein [Chthoniobacter sp.]|uniref:sialidase family protein n=1 Tax=Chthoniobacter sp. TaxID=2510640 RepID=UPI0032A5BB35
MLLLPLLRFALGVLLLIGSLSAGIAAVPLAQDYTVIYHNPDPEYYVEGPGLVRLDDGTFVAVVPVVPREQWSQERRAAHSVVHIFRSGDGGKTWQSLADLPYYSAAPWVDRGTLYLFANKAGAGKARNENLILLRSSDGGKTWSEPVTLFKGNYWNCHTGMVQRDHHIYWAIDDMSYGMNRGPRLVAGDLSGDPMDPHAWRISDAVTFPGAPEQLWNPKFAAQPSQYLEPNLIDVNGRLRVLAAVKIKRPTTSNLCAVLDAADDGTKLDLKFTQYTGMPGGHLKFCVLRDEPSKLFWATSNLSADNQGAFDFEKQAIESGHFKAAASDRRFLMLSYSVDAMNWFPAGCVAQAAKLSQSFMYARPVVDGDDLAIIARSSVNAPNQHDADNCTFHRVRDFRHLALNLYPEPETK